MNHMEKSEIRIFYWKLKEDKEGAKSLEKNSRIIRKNKNYNF